MTEKKLRGLSALVSSTATSEPSAPSGPPPTQLALLDVPIDGIVPNPRQPRRVFDPKAISDLAESIRQHGLLQPVIVRQADGRYELVAGERRWRAARLAGLPTIKAVASSADERASLVLSMIENLQREDLDPIEEATAYKTLIASLELTQERAAQYVGKERSTVANALRLLELPMAIQAKVISRALSPGHARVLLAVGDPQLQAQLAERAADKGLSVRQIEALVYGASGGKRGGRAAARPAHLADLERKISERLGSKVKLVERARGGKLIVEFASNEEFLRILELLGVS